MALRTVGLVTLPALMQLVHTFILRVERPTCTRMRWMFGFQRRFVRRWEWLTLIPKEGRLSQISQTEAIMGPWVGSDTHSVIGGLVVVARRWAGWTH